MEECIFCKIINNQIPSYKVYEDKDYLAFLTIMPINPGHTLLIPKKHVPYIFDLDEKTLSEILIKAQKIAHILKQAFHPKTNRIGIMVAGGEVHHTHLHLIPMDYDSDLTFTRQKSASPEELSLALKKIKDNNF